MAKLFKRIGTKKYKFTFEAYIEKVQIAVGFECEVSVIVKRGKREVRGNSELINKKKRTQLSLLLLRHIFSDLEEKCRYVVC